MASMNDDYSVLTDYIVIRPAPGHQIPPDWDGRWLDRADMPTDEPAHLDGLATWTATPTGRFEARTYEGPIAEVWEARRTDKPQASGDFPG